MTLIDIETLKTNLLLEKIEYDYSDEELELLLNNITAELKGYLGNIPIEPVTHKEIINNFKGSLYEVDYYPVSEVTSFNVGSVELTSDDYVLDEERGILYLHSHMSGLLVIEYVACLSDDVITNKVNPLLFDMVKYRLTSNFSGDGVISSIKEMDTSVSYDTSTSLGNLIQSRINDLRSCYSIRIKVI